MCFNIVMHDPFPKARRSPIFASSYVPHMVWHTAAKLCMLIKLDENNIGSNTRPRPGKNACDTNTDARPVCAS